MKRAFTLVEMLVVVGILLILATVVIRVSSSGLESARSVKCLTNMRVLADAATAFEKANFAFPLAGCVVDRGGMFEALYSWVGSDGSSTILSTYNQDPTIREKAIEGTKFFEMMHGSRDAYACPTHLNKMKKLPPIWSYVMSSFFGYDTSGSGQPEGDHTKKWRKREAVKPFEKRLLFAEIPFTDVVKPVAPDSGNSTEFDSVLQFDKEYIGFNHKSGNRWVAHVVYADCHVEKLMWPDGSLGLTEDDAIELTGWLCQGFDVSFNGDRYELLNE